MNNIDRESAVVELMKVENELRRVQARNAQLEAINKQLQQWNKELIEVLRTRGALPDNAGEGEV